jgi:outer membrane protein TolC
MEKRNIAKVIAALTGVVMACSGSQAQTIDERMLTMDDVVRLAQENSILGMSYRNYYLSSYWSFRSFKAEYRPALTLNSNLLNFDRSIVELQDFKTGEKAYRANYSLSNDIGLTIRQNIALTGGTLSLSTQLNRLDQFDPERKTSYYAQPLFLTYSQSLWGFNRFKWNKKIEPLNYELAKRLYIENMEQVAQTAVNYFWNYASAKASYERALTSFDESKRLYQTALTRFDMGTIEREKLLQLELSVLNDSLALNSRQLSMRTALNQLCSFIGAPENATVLLNISYTVPVVALDYEEVLARALANSSFQLNQTIQGLQADQGVAEAKANRGLSASVNARFGMSGTAATFDESFATLKDQEVVGISLSIPIVDWGLGKGRVKMSMAQAERTHSELEQKMVDFRQDLFTQVTEFNNQYSQCEISRRAAEIAEESYNIALKNFGTGTLSVTDMNQIRTERDNAVNQYITNIGNFWNSYFGIRSKTLFDYLTGTDINVEFDKLLK